MEGYKLIWHLIVANAICCFKILAFSETQFEGERSHEAQTIFAETLQIFPIVQTLSKSPSAGKKMDSTFHNEMSFVLRFNLIEIFMLD